MDNQQVSSFRLSIGTFLRFAMWAMVVGLILVVLLSLFRPDSLNGVFNVFRPKETVFVTPADRFQQPPRELEIVTILRRDGIPAILNPAQLTAEEANNWLAPSSQVLGVSINGEHRAYSLALLSRHEIANDVLGGKPIAVTWCPLCFTGIVYARELGGPGAHLRRVREAHHERAGDV